MKRAWIAAALLMVISLPPKAAGEVSEVSVLLNHCRTALTIIESGGEEGDTLEFIKGASCTSYLVAVLDFMTVFCSLSSDSEASQEIRNAFRKMGSDRSAFGTSSEVMIRIFVQYAEQHPEEWRRGSAVVVNSALRMASPCLPT